MTNIKLEQFRSNALRRLVQSASGLKEASGVMGEVGERWGRGERDERGGREVGERWGR